MFISFNHKVFENNYFIIRFKHINNAFFKRLFLLVLEAIIFVIITNILSLLCMIIILGSFSLTFLNDIILPMPLQFLGYLLMGSLFICGIDIINRKNISFVIFLSLIMLEFISFLGFLPLSLVIVTTQSFVFQNYIEMDKNLYFIIISAAILFLKCILINILSFYFYKRKDIFNR